jgi:hypothetical protein
MVAIGIETIVGIGVTIFLGLMGIVVRFLYTMSVNMKGIESNLQRLNDNIGTKLDSIEESTRESEKLLRRIEERTRDNGSNKEDNSGDQDPFEYEAEIIHSDDDSHENPDSFPDTGHIEDDDLEESPKSDTTGKTDWEFAQHVLKRIDTIGHTSEAEILSDISSESGDNKEESEPAEETQSHWVSEEAEDIEFLMSREVGPENSELYISVGIGDNVTQTNFHISRAGFPGLVGRDPAQNKLTKGLSELAKDMYGEDSVLSVRSGQIVVSLPTTEFDDIKDWIDSSAKQIDEIVSEDYLSKSETEDSEIKSTEQE